MQAGNGSGLFHDKALERTREHLANAAQKSRVGIGLERRLQADAANYLYQQTKYLDGMNSKSLRRRISPLTSEQTVLHYLSLYPCESLVSQLDDVSFLVSDSSSADDACTACTSLKNGFLEVEKLLESALYLRNAYAARTKQVVRERSAKGPTVQPTGTPPRIQASPKPQTRGVGSEAGGKSPSKIEARGSIDTDGDHDNDDDDDLYNVFQASDKQPGGVDTSDMAARQGSKRSSEIVRRPHPVDPIEYPGFYLFAPDLYARKSNPFLLMNEIAVIRFIDFWKPRAATGNKHQIKVDAAD
jgi:hypothetical protein